jgi:hypothetical protein
MNYADIIRDYMDENASGDWTWESDEAAREALDRLVAERDEFGSDSLQQQISELVRTARSEQVRANKAEAERDGPQETLNEEEFLRSDLEVRVTELEAALGWAQDDLREINGDSYWIALSPGPGNGRAAQRLRDRIVALQSRVTSALAPKEDA